jgi:hypothetical protein
MSARYIDPNTPAKDLVAAAGSGRKGSAAAVREQQRSVKRLSRGKPRHKTPLMSDIHIDIR